MGLISVACICCSVHMLWLGVGLGLFLVIGVMVDAMWFVCVLVVSVAFVCLRLDGGCW